MEGVSSITSLKSVIGDRLFGVSPSAIAKVVKNCTNLQYIFLTRIEDHFGTVFKHIAEHQSLVKLEFEECGGIDDSCIEALMKPGACPTLKYVDLNYVSVSKKVQKRLFAMLKIRNGKKVDQNTEAEH